MASLLGWGISRVRDVFDAIICYTLVMTCNECKIKPVAKELCNRHYLQMKRHGRLFKTVKEKRPAVKRNNKWYLPIGLSAKNGFALIDEEDKWLEKYNWSLSHGYPSHSSGLLHRIIMKAPKNKDIDHINGDILDCRKANLRLCTRAQNNMNRRIDNKTGYKGVYWHKVANKWAARIMYNRKSYHLGLFKNIEDASKAYDEKAIELFGEFARLNNG